MRPNVALIYVAIAVIALSAAAMLYRLTPLPFELGITFGAIIFFALATLDQAVSRAADQKAFLRQMEMGDHALQDAFNEIDMIRSRLVSLETDTQQIVDAGVAPIHRDLQAVGALLSQVTETVADTDHRLVTVEDQMKGLASRSLNRSKAQAAQVHAPAQKPAKQRPAESVSASFDKAVQAAKQKAQTEAAEAEVRTKKEAEKEVEERAKQEAAESAKQEAEKRRVEQEALERAKREAAAREEERSQALLKRVASAVENDRIEVALQSIVTLPLRRARAYATIFNLKLEGAGTLQARHAVPAVEAAGVSDVYDKGVVLRALALAEKFAARESASIVFVPISGSAIMQSRFADWLVKTLSESKEYAGRFVIEIAQKDVRAFSPIDFELLSTLADLGFRMSVTQLEDIRTDLFELSRHGFRYAKAPVLLFLGSGAGAKSDIHPEDLSDLAARNGMDLIVDQVESEAQIVELLECKLKYGQGNLFSRARVVDVTPRADVSDAGLVEDDNAKKIAKQIKLVEPVHSIERDETDDPQASPEPAEADGAAETVEDAKPARRRAFAQSLTPETVAPPSSAKASSSAKKTSAKKSISKKAATAKSAPTKSASRPAARRASSARALSRTA